MNRVELVEKIAAEHALSKAAAGTILDTVFSSIITAVQKGEPASFVGFGSFKQVARAARNGRNPATGAELKIAAAKLPKFTAGQAFRDAVDAKAAARRKAKAKAKAK